MKNNFRVLLAQRRLKIKDVHEATGISKSTLTPLYYERSKAPTLATVQKIAAFLNVTIDELLNTK